MNTEQLGDHAKLIRGITFKPADKCDPQDEGAIVCMRTKNIQAILDDSDLIAIPSSLVKNSEKIISIGDILVSSANSWNLVGKCCLVKELQYRSAAGGFISILRPKTELLDSYYLYRWFSSDEIQRRLRSFGNQTTNISNLDHKRTLKLQIPLPPLAEQQRIAGILDAADVLRVKRRESLSQLDTLLKSTFLDMFGDPGTNPMGWEVQPLQQLIQSDRPITYGILKPGPDTEDGVPYVRVVDIQQEQVLTDQLRRTTQEIARQYNRSKLIAGDLLMSIRGHVGRMAIVPPEASGANITQDTARLALSSANPAYVMQCLTTQAIQQHMAKRTKGVAVKGINLGDVKNIPIPVPAFDLQHRFAAIVESVEQQKAYQRAHLAELDTLFASLQSRAFLGDL